MSANEADRVVEILANAVSTRGGAWVEANPDAIRELLRNASLTSIYPVGPVLIALQLSVIASLEGQDALQVSGSGIDDLVQRVVTDGQLDAAVARGAVDTWIRVLHASRSVGGNPSGTDASSAIGGDQGTPVGEVQETAVSRLRRLRDSRRMVGSPAQTGSDATPWAGDPTIRISGAEATRLALGDHAAPDTQALNAPAAVAPAVDARPEQATSSVTTTSVTTPAAPSTGMAAVRRYWFPASALVVTVIGVGVAVVMTPGPPGAPAPAERAATAGPVQMAPIQPTASATPMSTEARWQETLGKLGVAWDKDWPGAIAALDTFRASAPDHDEAKQKLYVALVAYGQVLSDGGDTPKAIAQWVRARDLLPGKTDAPRLLAALTPVPIQSPTPVPAPTSVAPVAPTPVAASAPSRSGQWVTWGAKGSAPGQFSGPRGIAVDPQGNVYVSEFGNHRIQKFSSGGQPLSVIGRQGSQPGQFDQPFGLVVDARGGLVVAEWGNNRVQRLSATGQPVSAWGNPGGAKSAVRGEFNYPQGIAVDAQGTIYVTDSGNNRVQVFSSSGQLVNVWGQRGEAPGQFYAPDGIAVDSNGNLYIAEYGNNRVQVLSAGGRIVSQWGSKGSGPGEFNGAGGLAIDGQGNVYVADQGNSRIQKFSARGAFLAQWGAAGGAKGTGPGEFNTPIGIAIDRDGSIYVTDFGNNRVQKLPAR